MITKKKFYCIFNEKNQIFNVLKKFKNVHNGECLAIDF